MNVKEIVEGLKRADQMKAEVKMIVGLIEGHRRRLKLKRGHTYVFGFSGRVGLEGFYKILFNFPPYSTKGKGVELTIWNSSGIRTGSVEGIPASLLHVVHGVLDQLCQWALKTFPTLEKELETLAMFARD